MMPPLSGETRAGGLRWATGCPGRSASSVGPERRAPGPRCLIVPRRAAPCQTSLWRECRLRRETGKLLCRPPTGSHERPTGGGRIPHGSERSRTLRRSTARRARLATETPCGTFCPTWASARVAWLCPQRSRHSRSLQHSPLRPPLRRRADRPANELTKYVANLRVAAKQAEAARRGGGRARRQGVRHVRPGRGKARRRGLLGPGLPSRPTGRPTPATARKRRSS